jgi:hypothetical protein
VKDLGKITANVRTLNLSAQNHTIYVVLMKVTEDMNRIKRNFAKYIETEREKADQINRDFGTFKRGDCQVRRNYLNQNGFNDHTTMY